MAAQSPNPHQSTSLTDVVFFFVREEIPISRVNHPPHVLAWGNGERRQSVS